MPTRLTSFFGRRFCNYSQCPWITIFTAVTVLPRVCNKGGPLVSRKLRIDWRWSSFAVIRRGASRWRLPDRTRSHSIFQKQPKEAVVVRSKPDRSVRSKPDEISLSKPRKMPTPALTARVRSLPLPFQALKRKIHHNSAEPGRATELVGQTKAGVRF